MDGNRRVLLALASTAPLLAAPLLADAQSSEDAAGNEPVFDLGAGITPPRVIHQVSPKPDSGAKGFKISGVVGIALIVSSRGLPVDVHVVQSVDRDIDESAVDAVREWRFEPARKGDKPIAVRIRVEIRFHDV